MQSCKETDKNPEFSVVPYIEVESIAFYQSSTIPDTIRFKIHYLDGDNDIGTIDYEDTSHLYEPFYVKTDEEGNILRFDSSPDIYNECDYTFLNEGVYYTTDGKEVRLVAPGDTIAIQRNKFAYSMRYEFLVRNKNSKLYEPYSGFMSCDYKNKFKYGIPQIDQLPLRANSSNFSPIIYPINAWEGTITCDLTSSAIATLFKNDSIKLRVQIFDRGFHESNVVETDPIYIE